MKPWLIVAKNELRLWTYKHRGHRVRYFVIIGIILGIWIACIELLLNNLLLRPLGTYLRSIEYSEFDIQLIGTESVLNTMQFFMFLTWLWLFIYPFTTSVQNGHGVMRSQHKLDFREIFLQLPQQPPLPHWVQMPIKFIDEDDALGFCKQFV